MTTDRRQRNPLGNDASFDLERDGFSIFPSALTGAEVDALREAVENMLSQPPTDDEWLHRLDVDSPFNFNYLQRVHLWRRSPAFLPIYRSLPLIEALRRTGRTATYRLFFDAFMAKLAYGEISRWHVDGSRWPFDATGAVTVWISLEEITAANGCLAYLPGSHRVLRAMPSAAYPPGIGGLQALVPELLDYPVVTCPLPPGSIVVHDPFVAHAVLPNLTSKDRWAVTLNLVPTGAVFNGQPSELLPPEGPGLVPGASCLADDELWPQL